MRSVFLGLLVAVGLVVPVEAVYAQIDVRVELSQVAYKVGDPMHFSVTANKDCYFLVFTIDAFGRVEVHDPNLAPEYMGPPLLRAGERRPIPVPGAPGKAIVGPPTGTHKIGAVCGEKELKEYGLTQFELKAPARAGKRSFEFHLDNKIAGIRALSKITANYEVVELRR